MFTIKKKEYLYVVVSYTIFSIGIILWCGRSTEGIVSEQYKQTAISEEDKENNIKEVPELPSAAVEGSKVLEKENINENYIENRKKPESYISDEEKEAYGDKDTVIDWEKIDAENNVLKVAEDEIEKDLSLHDKAVLLKLYGKLSDNDCRRIEEYINYDNKCIGFSKTVHILKKRLSAKEYKEVKEILSKYIDVDKIESFE